MATITDDFAGILSTVRRPGDFYVSGRTDMLAPRIEVEGVGPIALPLLPMQAEQLVAAAERAPYGRGAETLVDTAVRRSWQIGPDQVRIAGKHWGKTLDEIVARAADGLGVSEPVSAELYKLLIYDKGSFFVSHRDTEKAPGMFATLVLALPSHSEGGELVVRHKGREATLDLRTEDPSEIAFAAFYADCVHEVLPITAGCRATLIYNLVRKGKQGAALLPPSYDSETERVVALLQGWTEAKGTAMDEAPKKLIYPLEHAYTPAELGFVALKGADAAAAGVLLASAPRAGCDLHLALLQIEESGIAEYTGYRSRRGREEVDMVAGEVCDGARYLHEWRRSDGSHSTLGRLPFEEEEVSPPDALEDMDPDEEHFHEATGNEGASFDRTYSRAVLVVWPSKRTLAVLNQAGLSVTVPYLADLVARWKGEGGEPGSPLYGQALEMAGHMLATWPTGTWHSYDNRDSRPSEMGRMLALLAELGARDEAGRLLEKLVDRRGHDKSDNAAILGALTLFPPQRAAGRLQNILASGAIEAFGACSALLAGAVKSSFASRPAMLLEAAEALVEALPGDPAAAPKDAYGRPLVATVDASAVADLAVALDAVDGALAQRAAHHMLAWPSHFSLDDALVPALRGLIEAGVAAGGAAFDTLHAACLAHLKGRAAEPLEAPKDWSRASGVGCKCVHCTALSRFLAGAANPSWSLKAAQPIRDHVESTIRNARCDVDTRTERRGSPHILVCTKNQASYERRVAQRKLDLTGIAVLEGIG
jgi:predicted 2-oxoglutarate/Fe(II)-dependent dioxygenase YbiX